MISIITAVYNQLAMNRLYYESICKNTDGEWELIIIDNGSTDGSREFFESLGSSVRVIANTDNYSYPYCQNQGIAIAKGEILAFFNNDILLSPHWDTRAKRVLGHGGNEVVTLGANERMATDRETRRLFRRWKRVKYPMLKLFGRGRKSLTIMTGLMYGDWSRYAERMWKRHGLLQRSGFVGSAVLMTRRGLDLLGEFDPTIQAGDFDLYMRSEKRFRENGDVRPMTTLPGVLHHHFGRLTFRAKFPPFADGASIRSLEEKWGAALCGAWLKGKTGH